MNKDFSRIITILRKEKKLSQKEAANDLGISQALLSHYEKGIRECSLDFVIKVADYYEVSTDFLLGRTSERYSEITDISEEISDEKRKSISQMINKRFIVNSINIIYEYLIKINSRKLSNLVSDYLMMNVYKIFRQIYKSNPKNKDQIFTIDDYTYKTFNSLSLESINTKINAATNIKLDKEYINKCSDINISEKSINEEFPMLCSSLFSVIQHSEKNIKNYIS